MASGRKWLLCAGGRCGSDEYEYDDKYDDDEHDEHDDEYDDDEHDDEYNEHDEHDEHDEHGQYEYTNCGMNNG